MLRLADIAKTHHYRQGLESDDHKKWIVFTVFAFSEHKLARYFFICKYMTIGRDCTLLFMLAVVFNLLVQPRDHSAVISWDYIN